MCISRVHAILQTNLQNIWSLTQRGLCLHISKNNFRFAKKFYIQPNATRFYFCLNSETKFGHGCFLDRTKVTFIFDAIIKFRQICILQDYDARIGLSAIWKWRFLFSVILICPISLYGLCVYTFRVHNNPIDVNWWMYCF